MNVNLCVLFLKINIFAAELGSNLNLKTSASVVNVQKSSLLQACEKLKTTFHGHVIPWPDGGHLWKP